MNNDIMVGYDTSVPRERSVIGVFGWVMGLVAIAIGFAAFGSFLGRDLSRGTALVCFFIGFGMLIAQSFAGERLRYGSLAMGWLFGLAMFIGLGLGPAIGYFASVEPDTLVQAIAGTAGTVLAMGSLGLALSKDLAKWMRPVSMIVFAACAVSIVFVLFASSTPIWLSMIIYGVSALLLVIDFNYLRKHGTENDAIVLATGIFVAIVNIFTSLLNIFGGD